MEGSTQENLKWIVQIQKFYLCLFQIRGRNFSLSFCNEAVRLLGQKAFPRQAHVIQSATHVSFRYGFLSYGLASQPGGSSYTPCCFMQHGNRDKL